MVPSRSWSDNFKSWSLNEDSTTSQAHFCSIMNKYHYFVTYKTLSDSLFLQVPSDCPQKGNEQVTSLVACLRVQVWRLFAGRERREVHFPSGCWTYWQPHVWPGLACERSAAIPLGLSKDCFKYLRWALRLYILCNSSAIHEKLLKWDFSIAYMRGNIWQPDRENQIFLEKLYPKVQLFCHTFLSLSQGWKVFGSKNCRACKRHGFPAWRVRWT